MKTLVGADCLLNGFFYFQTACICLNWVHRNVVEIFWHLEVHRKLSRWMIIFWIILFPILVPYLQKYIQMDWKYLDRTQAALSFYHFESPQNTPFRVNSKLGGLLSSGFWKKRIGLRPGPFSKTLLSCPIKSIPAFCFAGTFLIHASDKFRIVSNNENTIMIRP